jgi:hypothetical protein
MRGLALMGFIALAFGIGSYYATDHFGVFGIVNLAVGGVALAAALFQGIRRVRRVGSPYARRVVMRGIGVIALSLGLGVACERAAHWSALRADWTFERRYELSPLLAELLREMPGLRIRLFSDPLDPRIRRTRLLVEELARVSDGDWTEYDIERVPEDAEVYGVGSSNSLVLEHGDDFEVVERPLEGAIYEALYRLRAVEAGVIGLLRGEGEGDPELENERGFAGLAAALATEGYELRSLVTLSLDEVPAEIDAILAIAPQRHVGARAQYGLRRFLERGGSLIALLEPGVDSGLEELLAAWGIATPDEVIVDPASGEGFGSEPRNLCPLAYNYETHPLTKGLDRDRMTFFCGARSFVLHKTAPDDELRPLVFSSGAAWLRPSPAEVLERGAGETAPEVSARGFQPIAVSGRYVRNGVESRIVAVGDSDFASNRYLRAVYNLDFVLNSVHWALGREPQIALRPKLRDTVQFPLPVQSSLQMLYGVGLLLPELLLIAGGILWLRRRAS